MSAKISRAEQNLNLICTSSWLTQMPKIILISERVKKKTLYNGLLRNDGITEFLNYGIPEFRNYGISEFRNYGISDKGKTIWH